MKVLITGGAGFIGSHLAETLCSESDRYEVVVVDNLSTGRLENLDNFRSRISFVEGDLGSEGEWSKYFEGVDWVFHVAALADIVPSIRHPEEYFRANVNGTLNVLRACHENKVKKLVYIASSSSYGIPDTFPTPETSPIKPQYPYALTKHIGEELVMHWEQVYRLPAISLRFFNVYGPRSRTSGTYGAVFGVFLAQKLAGKPFTVVGDGNQTRDFTYVSDVVSSLICAAKSPISGRIYNVGSGSTVSVNRLVELLGGGRGFIPKRPGEPDCTYADISRIKRELGWTPMIPIEDGVGFLLQHIDYWKEAPVWTPEKISRATEDWFRYLGGDE